MRVERSQRMTVDTIWPDDPIAPGGSVILDGKSFVLKVLASDFAKLDLTPQLGMSFDLTWRYTPVGFGHMDDFEIVAIGNVRMG